MTFAIQVSSALIFSIVQSLIVEGEKQTKQNYSVVFLQTELECSDVPLKRVCLNNIRN